MSEQRVAKARYVIRTDLKRRRSGDVRLPLGVFLSEPGAKLLQGFESRYHAGDDDCGAQYEYRLLLSAERIFDVARRLFVEFLPDEVHGLFEEFSYDAFRDSDTYMSDEFVPRARIIQAWDTYGPYFVEDGRSGFGALSFDSNVEVFIEEHGVVFVAVDLQHRGRIEAFAADLGLKEMEALRGIENFRHQHREILEPSRPDDPSMGEADIKYSVIESLGMKPTNLREGEPDAVPTPFWVHLDLDLSFARSKYSSAFCSWGVMAASHEEAMAMVENRLTAKAPGALVARVREFYRITQAEAAAESKGPPRNAVDAPGFWFESGIIPSS